MASVLGQYGSEFAAQDPGASESMLQSLEFLPPAYATVGWNALRGSKTILGGGFDERHVGRLLSKAGKLNPFNIIPGGKRLRGSNPLGPRSWGRFANQNMLYEDRHSPLDILARSANWAANKGMGMVARQAEGQGFASDLASNMINKARESKIMGESGGKQEYFSRGFLARADASARIGRMKGPISGRRLKSVQSFIGKDEGLARSMGQAEEFGSKFGLFEGWNNKSYSHFVGASMKGRFSQYASGYLNTARSGTLDPMERAVLGNAGKESYLQGAQRATNAMSKLGVEKAEGFGFKVASEEAEKKFGTAMGEKVGMSMLTRGGMEGASLMGAEALGMAIPGVNIALTAMMVYDFSKMGLSMMKGGVQTMIDAGKSMKGSVEKGVMGGGYRDNSVAATSRQRGVMAIQNSRLNARSVLGSEAGALASHFG